MALTRDARSQLLSLLHELGPRGSRQRFIDAVHAHGPSALDEVGELPGVDQLRAAMLRALPDLAEDLPDDALRAADEALAVYPDMARSDDPMLTLARHPAWVGLAAIELAELRGQDGTSRAIRLARAGFDGTGGTSDGEVLWALAEAADESGWTDRSAALLEAAVDAPFDDEDGRGEVRLLLALRKAEDDDPRAADLLQAVLDADGPTRRRVHAAWVLAAMVRPIDPQRAIRVLAEALSLLDEDPESDAAIRARVAQALHDLGAPAADG